MTGFVQTTRVLAYMQRLQVLDPVAIEFGVCVVASLAGRSKKVSCELRSNKLVLSNVETEDHGLPIQHSKQCPMNELTESQRQSLTKDVRSGGVAAAVCVVVESSDGKILLTRRSKHMRTFPNVWVPPGGGIEPNETLLQAGLRELHEETGLNFKPEEILDARPYCLWESVYPPLLSRGLPKRQHIVVYFLMKLNLLSSEVDPKISLSAEETDAFMWLSKGDARQISSSRDHKSKDFSDSLTVFELCEGYVQKPWSILLVDAPTSGSDIERISTGTKFAIDQWVTFDT